ncbi:MAG: PIN domain-containing protein [Cyanosarcina radialis HA8281-LM2]|jgi:predicted nucleic acid-binding protein|nr:PIN domain-containing protein [Cyanosarcina radialis HA8281-LM2]
MRVLFADTFYWIALLNPKDENYQTVKSFNRTLIETRIVTTDEVLIEFLNFYSSYNHQMRQNAVHRIDDIMINKMVRVIPQNRESFMAGLSLYKQRLDKGYSLTDCISMITMRQLSIDEVLTHDKHFRQEGFTILF